MGMFLAHTRTHIQNIPGTSTFAKMEYSYFIDLPNHKLKIFSEKLEIYFLKKNDKLPIIMRVKMNKVTLKRKKNTIE